MNFRYLIIIFVDTTARAAKRIERYKMTDKMTNKMDRAGIQAQLAWRLLFARANDILEEPAEDYAGMLEGMEAAQLLMLIEMAQERLQMMGVNVVPASTAVAATTEPAFSHLYIDPHYTIRLDSPQGPGIPLRPLVKAVFILFLKHPEGILLKERHRYAAELEAIYAVISPNTSKEDRQKRIRRLVDATDNSFSEKASVLNATLDRMLPQKIVEGYKIQGTNGHPRRIPLDPLLVIWAA